MSPDLDELLCKRYPAIFADRNNPDSCMYRGFECGNGWFNLIDRLCFRIHADVDRDGRPQPAAAQVKEKLGGLRIYWREADDGVRALADFACDLSHVTCEVCGAPGEAVQAPRRALRVRCQAHCDQVSAIAEQGEHCAITKPEVPVSQAADEYFELAVELVVRSQTATVSLLQRHLKLGYTRATRLMAALESVGVVSAPSEEGIRRVMRSDVPEAGPPREGV
jgi:DNA segregation ATPase FtsK/SpoIIIE-like protein